MQTTDEEINNMSSDKERKRNAAIVPPWLQCFWCAVTQCHHSTGTASPTATHIIFRAHDTPEPSTSLLFYCVPVQKHSNLKNAVLDMTDFNTRVLCSRSVGEQRLKPKWWKEAKIVVLMETSFIAALILIIMSYSLYLLMSVFFRYTRVFIPHWPCWCREEQHLVGIKWFSLYEERHIWHLFIIQEMWIWGSTTDMRLNLI